MSSPAPVPHRVVVLAIAPVVGFDMAIPTMTFGAARDEAERPLYDVQVVGLGGREVATTVGYGVRPQGDESALAEADTVIVPSTVVEGPRHEGTLDPELAAALRLIRPGTRTVSICTGAFVLAAAGLLDGRPVTTHWKHAEAFARLYPRVQLDADVLFVDDGDVLTSAGLAAGIDLCLHLLRRDHGTEVANHVARYCVVPPWREGGQAQFIERPLPSAPAAARATTARAREWALAHLQDDLDVPALASQAGMSVRTFTRHFRAETGRAPGAWLIEQRVRQAQRLLEVTDLPVDAVATRSGLGTSASLRQHLRAVAGVSPSAYRRTFRGRSA